FSLVNLIAGKEVVKELLQLNLEKRIEAELDKILNENDYRATMEREYDNIIESLDEAGSSERVAARMTEILEVL
ncbi:MAG TPA: lipid-A-disaccharide synthase, partial [Bacteroidales bacterium]|nr:lipid-A-disaccharide synthase [Bacteroidales bacterium]